MAALAGQGEWPPELRYLRIVDRVGGWLNYVSMPPRAIEDTIIAMNAEKMAQSAGAFFNKPIG